MPGFFLTISIQLSQVSALANLTDPSLRFGMVDAWFDIEHCRIKVKVTVGFQVFPNYQLSGPTTQVWYKLGSMYVYLILIYKIYEYCHALFS